MKGTLFSADFVKDGNGDSKLIEINTDTACIPGLASNIDFTDLYSVLATNTITDLQVIYKEFQEPILDRLKAQKPAGVTITEHKEIHSSIYPTSIADDATKFILRLAYDENALLDAIYAKNDANLHGLYGAGGPASASLVVSAKHAADSSNINYVLNGPTEPDFAVKPKVPTKSGLDFYKLGGSTGSIEDRINEFTASIDTGVNVITNYVSDATDTAKSVRSYQIVYGADLDITWLGAYTIDALFTHTLSLVYDDNKVINKLSNKHYYEFATNDISDSEGVYYEAKIKKEDGNYDVAEDAVIGTLYDSYYVSGSPMTDNSLILDSWSFAGDTLPSGSYSTSSSLQSNTSVTMGDNSLRKITLDDGQTVLLGGANRALVHDNVNNETSYLRARDIKPGFKLFDENGASKGVTAHDIIILDNDSDSKIIELGVEDVDNYVVSGSNAIIHNAPCFIAGTKVNMEDGSMKNIEDVKEGDQVCCWDFEINGFSNEKVLITTETEDQKVVQITFKCFGNDLDIFATPDHPFFVEGGKGWACVDPELLKEKTGMEAALLDAGDSILTGKEGETSIVTGITSCDWTATVYNLDNVFKYNNYFIYGMLVHNRFIFSCHTYDSKVEMADGTHKAIGEVKVGDKVKSIKDGIVTEGTVTDHLIHVTNDVMRTIKTTNGYTEINHPILVDGEWVAAKELGEVESVFVDNFYNLEIDGNISESDHNYIVDGMVSSGLGDSKELNAKYQRQPKQLTKHL